MYEKDKKVNIKITRNIRVLGIFVWLNCVSLDES